MPPATPEFITLFLFGWRLLEVSDKLYASTNIYTLEVFFVF